jgi:hypothetical protein
MYMDAKKLMNQKNYIMKNKKRTELEIEEIEKELQGCQWRRWRRRRRRRRRRIRATVYHK